ncbi:hypothetical protein DM01DRAFT_1340591 [Hesseltinella vesiculosa]|uniref:Uncharacterized protein n=1 Tax=Hesseltinella vesiculosa TaxID=101127 RepID=A0A1X2G3W3_9FUNG|nr:hypothetical protein DM01DRAFT_1340591 [Hesseltinella vesiculosa]
MLSAGQASCFIYGLKYSQENAFWSLEKLRTANLIPVLLAHGDPTCPVAISRTKYEMEPWRFTLLPGAELQQSFTASTSADSTTNISINAAILPSPDPDAYSTSRFTRAESASTISTNPSTVMVPESVAPSRVSIMDLTKGILLTESVEGITDEVFLDEHQVHEIISSYLPDGAVSEFQLADWVAKDGLWGGTKRRRTSEGRKHGRVYHLVKEAHRDYTWIDLHNVHQFRRHVRLTETTICTIGYVRRSNTKDTTQAKMKSIELQSTKLKNKLLCEKIFGSYNTSSSSDLQSRDYNGNRKWLHDIQLCSGNTQDMHEFISSSNRKIRLVTIDFAGFCTNIDHLRKFFIVNKSVVEIVIDMGHKVEVYTRRQILKDDNVVAKFNCRIPCVNRSK